MHAPAELRFVVEGKPVPWHRPAFNPKTQTRFTDPESRAYQKRVRAEGMAATRWTRTPSGNLVRRVEPWPMGVEYVVELLVVFPDRRRRDVDNVTKGVLDALNATTWDDDSQVRRIVIERADPDARRPRLEVRIAVYDSAGQLELAAAGGAP